MFKRESQGITEIYSAAECLRVQNDQLDDNKTIVANCRNKTIITCYHESNNKRPKKKNLIPVSIYININKIISRTSTYIIKMLNNTCLALSS